MKEVLSVFRLILSCLVIWMLSFCVFRFMANYMKEAEVVDIVNIGFDSLIIHVLKGVTVFVLGILTIIPGFIYKLIPVHFLKSDFFIALTISLYFLTLLFEKEYSIILLWVKGIVFYFIASFLIACSVVGFMLYVLFIDDIAVAEAKNTEVEVVSSKLIENKIPQKSFSIKKIFGDLPLGKDNPPLNYFEGKMYNKSKEYIGYTTKEGFRFDENEHYKGRIFEDGRLFDESNKYQGKMSKKGRFYNKFGEYEFEITEEGKCYDEDGFYTGRIYK